MTIAVIDYGAGNVASVLKALSAVGADVSVVRQAEDVIGIDGLVIPGVGHFDSTASLDDRWRRYICAQIDEGMPVLGICLGMHWLFAGSDEARETAGLGIFEGRCVRLEGPVKVPHVGWNTLAVALRPSKSLDGIPDGAWAYFTHSFAAPVAEGAVAITTHGMPFASCVERGSVWGTQWHPEKSGSTGLRLLRNFMDFVRTSGEARLPARPVGQPPPRLRRPAGASAKAGAERGIGVPASDDERGPGGTKSPGNY